jgi:dihydroxy-acid dehydratase
VAVIMATGGSTNAVLHFLAIAHAAGVEWDIDDFERIRKKTPVLCDLKPSGKYLAVDLHRAGGIPQVMKILLNAGLLHGECITIQGKTIAEVLQDVPDEPRADQDVIRPISNPMYAQGHLAILKGNLSPEGAVAKITGPAGDSGRQDQSWRCNGAALPGPQGRTGHARDARPHRRTDRRRPGRERGTDH